MINKFFYLENKSNQKLLLMAMFILHILIGIVLVSYMIIFRIYILYNF